MRDAETKWFVFGMQFEIYCLEKKIVFWFEFQWSFFVTPVAKILESPSIRPGSDTFA